MAAKLRRNAIIVAGLAVFFAWAFMVMKHDPALRAIIPFGDDPYDAIGSFAFITSPLLALASLARTFLPRLAARSGAALYTLRSQAAVVFCVLVTVASYIVAMARHPSMWIGAAGQAKLLVLLSSLIALSLAVLALTRNRQEPGTPRHYAQAASVWLGSLLVLSIYPEKLIAGTVGHLFTIVVGDLLLFAPVAMLVRAWLPFSLDSRNRGSNRNRTHVRYLPLTLAAATGLVMGAAAFLGEMNEGGPNPPLRQLLFVAAVYLGLGMVGLLIGYASLARLLGFIADGPISSGEA
jgi:hypothetical protein